MPVELVRETLDVLTLRLEGAYTLFEIELELQGVQGAAGTLLVDFSQARVDHSAFELERLAALFAAVSGSLVLRTRDTLRFGFARTVMGYCSARGVNVRIDHSSH